MASILGQPMANPYGQGMANMLGAAYLQNQFGKYLDAAERPPINIDALRGISDPRIMQMAAQMLLADQRARGGAGFGVQPGGFQYLTPEERRNYMVNRITGSPSGGANPALNEIGDLQRIINAGTEIVPIYETDEAGNKEKVGEKRVVKEGQESAVKQAKDRLRELTTPNQAQEKAAAQAALPEMQKLKKDVERSVGRTKRLATFANKLNKLPRETQKKIGQLYNTGKASLEEIIAAVENE